MLFNLELLPQLIQKSTVATHPGARIVEVGAYLCHSLLFWPSSRPFWADLGNAPIEDCAPQPPTLPFLKALGSTRTSRND